MRGRIDIWEKRALVICRFGEVAGHAHAVGTLLVGLDGPFELRTTAHPWTWAGAAYLPPGQNHALRVHQQRLAVVLMAPGHLELRSFARVWDLCPSRVHLLPTHLELNDLLHACWRGQVSAAELQLRLSALIGSAPDVPCIDKRVQKLVSRLVDEPQCPISAGARAAHLGVQRSRARELLRKELGVSWQQLRRWERMRALSRMLAQGHNLTRAAHSLGFSDSSQLTRDFRATFGVAPGRLYRQAQLIVHPPM